MPEAGSPAGAEGVPMNAPAMSGASRGELEALAFCMEDTGLQIARARVEAAERGSRPPTAEERERLRFDAALYLLRGPSARGRRLGAAYLLTLEGAA